MDSSPDKSFLAQNIFMYRKELCRRRRNNFTLIKMKTDSTQQLLLNCAKKLWECDQDDVETFSRLLTYRDGLSEQQNYLLGHTNGTYAMDVDKNTNLNCDVEMELDVDNSANLNYFAISNNFKRSKEE